MRRRHSLRWMIPAVCLAAAAGLSARAGPRGHLLIIGGGDRPPAFSEKFIALAGEFGKGKIVIFTMASGVPQETGPELVEEFTNAGAPEAAAYHLTREEAAKPESVRILDGAGGVFFSGGDQSRVTAVLLDTPLHAALLEFYEEGGVVSGTSAGAAVMSEVMITGDEKRKVEEGKEWATIEAGNVATVRGLGFLKTAVVDQHFIARKRNNRLISVLAEHPDLLGLGIDEGTAILVKPDGTFEVMGAGQVVVFDPGPARIRILPWRLAAFAGMSFHLLVAGDVFDLTGRKVKNP